MGNPGQANHASANAFLDQLAGLSSGVRDFPVRPSLGGAWSDIGEAAEQKDRIERQRSALGGRWFTPQQGMRALDRIVRQDVTTSVVMAMDWSVFEEAVDDRPAFLEDLLSSVTEDETDVGVSSDDLLSRLASASAGEREDLLVTFLQQELQAVLRLPSTPAPNVGFFDLGMDSLMAVELRNRLNRALADTCKISNTVVFDYPEIQALARHLDCEIGEVDSDSIPEMQPSPAPQPAPQQAPRPAPQPVAQVRPVLASRTGAGTARRNTSVVRTGSQLSAWRADSLAPRI